MTEEAEEQSIISKILAAPGIAAFISKLRIGGETTKAVLNENKANTAQMLKRLFRRSVMGDVPMPDFAVQLEKSIKTRKRHTLNTLKNIMSGVRGEARALQAQRLKTKGRWFNNGTLDSVTTRVCAHFMGESWDLPYSEIPDKPPRVSVIPHPCRSFLTFTAIGEAPPLERPFMEQFEDNEGLQLDLLGPTRFEAYQAGEFKIKSFKDYEKVTLTTIEELGI